MKLNKHYERKSKAKEQIDAKKKYKYGNPFYNEK
jgi:hypothetical protein